MNLERSNTKILLDFIPLLLLSIVIFYFSHQEQVVTPDLGFTWQDKLFHFSAFLVYGLFIQFGFRHIEVKYKTIIVILIGSLYGLSDELHQYFIPGRFTEFYDWLADTLGVIFSILVWNKLVKKLFN